LKVADDDQSGQPVETVTEATVQQAEELIWANRRIIIHSVTTALGFYNGLAYSIMHEHLKFWKVCAQWVSRKLKNWEEIKRISLPLQHLLWYADEGEDTLDRTVTGDESLVHDYQPESKHASMQWQWRCRSGWDNSQ
jgi:hypothetical protein